MSDTGELKALCSSSTKHLCGRRCHTMCTHTCAHVASVRCSRTSHVREVSTKSQLSLCSKSFWWTLLVPFHKQNVKIVFNSSSEASDQLRFGQTVYLTDHGCRNQVCLGTKSCSTLALLELYGQIKEWNLHLLHEMLPWQYWKRFQKWPLRTLCSQTVEQEDDSNLEAGNFSDDGRDGQGLRHSSSKYFKQLSCVATR